VYLGVDLDKKKLNLEELKADKELALLSQLLEEKEIKFLNEVKDRLKKELEENKENRYEAFTSFFTYDSNAIEGNSLTLEETSFLLFEKIVPSSKSLREINETLNHKSAFDYMLAYKGDITKEFILELHKQVVRNTLKESLIPQIGKYRVLQVYIHGRDWLPPKPTEVPKEMKTLLSWYTLNKNKLHPLIVASYFHVAFETIHPFVDGNGRVGRLLLNFILHKNKFPMINIPNKVKFKYYNALKIATLEGNLKPFIELMLELYKEAKINF
jgi:Fic family protein